MTELPSNPLGLKVWPRDLYAHTRYRNGAELIFVSRDSIVHQRNSIRLGEIRVFVRRFSQMHLLVDRQPYNMSPTVADVIGKNRKSHDPNTARGIVDLYDTCSGMTAIICGSGRSLVRDVDMIAEAKHSGAKIKVFTVNSALKAFPAGVVDHHFMLDWSAKPEWWEGIHTEGTGLIISPAVPPMVVDHFKDIRYFSGPVPVADKAGAVEWDKVGELEQCLHASYSLLHLCYKMGFDQVVLTGHDYACTDNWYHWDARARADFAEKEKLHCAEDVWGNTTITGWRMMRNMHVLNASMKFCEMDGMPVVNASMDGILASERQAKMEDCLGSTLPAKLVEPGSFCEETQTMMAA